jgi:hypothetical protein
MLKKRMSTKPTASQIRDLIENIYIRCVGFNIEYTLEYWDQLANQLTSTPAILNAVYLMELTCGEPAILQVDDDDFAFYAVDCSPESPKDRRSLCYDDAALNSRKENKPNDSAIGMASTMGITLLNEAFYRTLQSHITVDQKTSSWLLTPEDIRSAGGALFGDYRYGHTFIYHNGAQSYYASRGFRGCVQIPISVD